MKFDEKDTKMVEEIMKNPKITDKELADKIDLSRSGAAKRRKKLEENNEIMYFAAPNLSRRSSEIAKGVFGFSSDVGLDKAKEVAKGFAERKEVVSCQVRLTARNEWGVDFTAISDQLKDKEGTHKMIDEWKKDVNEKVDDKVKRIDVSSTTYFVKVLGRNI